FWFLLAMRPRPPSSTLLPYTTLFRSCCCAVSRQAGAVRFATSATSAPRSSLAGGSLCAGRAYVCSRFTDCAPSRAARSTVRSERSEEHTSELQSPDHLVCRLLLEKKK